MSVQIEITISGEEEIASGSSYPRRPKLAELDMPTTADVAADIYKYAFQRLTEASLAVGYGPADPALQGHSD